MTPIRDVARQAARFHPASRTITREGADQLADAVTLAVLKRTRLMMVDTLREHSAAAVHVIDGLISALSPPSGEKEPLYHVCVLSGFRRNQGVFNDRCPACERDGPPIWPELGREPRAAQKGPSAVEPERCGKELGEGFICVLWKGHEVACCGQRPPAVEPEPTNIIFDGRLSGTSAVPLAPTPPDKRTIGLYAKFNVTRTDGKSAPGEKHDGCEYFVLDVTHDKHAHAALKAYADSCEAEYPLLARDVRIQAKTQILSGLIHSSPSPGAVETPTCTECEGRGYIEQGEGLVSTRCDSCAGGSR